VFEENLKRNARPSQAKPSQTKIKPSGFEGSLKRNARPNQTQPSQTKPNQTETKVF
jgi:hypothetical protein